MGFRTLRPYLLRAAHNDRCWRTPSVAPMSASLRSPALQRAPGSAGLRPKQASTEAQTERRDGWKAVEAVRRRLQPSWGSSCTQAAFHRGLDFDASILIALRDRRISAEEGVLRHVRRIPAAKRFAADRLRRRRGCDEALRHSRGRYSALRDRGIRERIRRIRSGCR